MKKGCLWAIGIFFLLAIIGKCAGSTEDTTSSVDSVAVDQADKVSAEEEARIAAEKAREDSLNAVKITELKKYFTEKKDEFSDKKWVEPQTRPRYTNQNGYCMYFAVEGGKATNPRFLIQYEADDWLFIQYMIFNIDGENITFTPTKMETDCGNGGRIWEWCDEYAADLEPLIKKIAYANTVKIKMVGRQYHNVKTMSSKQIQYFKYSYEYYKALGGRFN
ncbi:MAG: hypothetical protein MJZ41_16240 [Bacteroidaceae bacterium]|nr:hypothetical protein [Bacteroidaceae bacterium]